MTVDWFRSTDGSLAFTISADTAAEQVVLRVLASEIEDRGGVVIANMSTLSGDAHPAPGLRSMTFGTVTTPTTPRAAGKRR